MKNLYAAVAITAVLLLFLGCTAADEFSDLSQEVQKPSTYSFVKNAVVPVNASCSCMFCVNVVKPKPWYWPFGADDLSYFGANCTFETCTPAIVDARLKDTKTDIKTYMIGTGTGFADFAYANQWCRNGMDMAVKWQYDPTGIHRYPIPSFERAQCMMENNVIPVYVLYSNGSNAAISDYPRVSAVATAAKDYGPIIIVTEMNSGFEFAQQVASQAYAIRTSCPNCLVAIAPPMGNTTVLDEIMKYANQKKVKDLNGNLRAPVDLLAVGVDSANYPNDGCKPQDLLYYARNFSAYAMYKYNITSIWPYMVIREGTEGINSCTWESGANAKMFSDFFLTEMSTSILDGVVGAASYSFTGVNNPLNISGRTGDADMNVLGPNSATSPLQSQLDSEDPRFSHWYGFCAVYTAAYFQSGAIQTQVDNRYLAIVPQDNWNRFVPVYEIDASGNPVIDQATGKPKQKIDIDQLTGKEIPVTQQRVVSLVDCPTTYQNSRFNWLLSGSDSDTGYIEGYNPATGEPIISSTNKVTASQYKEKSAPGNVLPFEKDSLNGWDKAPLAPWFRCDFCVRENDAVMPFPSVTKSSISDSTYCTTFPEVDVFADRFDVDPFLARAIVIGESNFQPCATSHVSLGVGGCNANNVRLVTDPYNVCGPFDDTQSTIDPNTGKKVDKKPCAYGIMQSNELPYNAWDKSSPNWYDGRDVNGKSIATGGDLTPADFAAICYLDYNPFNATHSACVGTYKIRAKWDEAASKVDDFVKYASVGCPGLFANPNTDGDTLRVQKKWWTAAFTAAKYLGLVTYSDRAQDYCDLLTKSGTSGPAVSESYKTTDANGKEVTKTAKYTDYLDYFKQKCINSLSDPTDTVGIVNCDYMGRALRNYYGLTQGCATSDCPYGKLIKNRPTSP